MTVARAICCAANRETCDARQGAKGGTTMSTGPKGTEQDSIAPCSVCGRIEPLFGLPGRTDKCCLECSADLATAILLSTEIDAATLAGRRDRKSTRLNSSHT